MRYIEWLSASVPEDWQDEAEELLEKLKDCEKPGERKKIINKNRLWTDDRIKTLMQYISHNKCWYCETKELRSDNPVDHFRPKNRVKDAKEHEGYWWLTYDWKNYRFACTYCNSRRKDKETGETGGKHDNFPLCSTYRASAVNDNLDDEKPMLLDPIVKNDVKLLFFDQDGSIAPVPNISEEDEERVWKSRELYNLDHSDTKRRRKEIYQFIKRKVLSGNKRFKKLNDISKGNPQAEEWLQEIIDDLKEKVKPSAEFSAAANIYLSGLLDSPDAMWIYRVWDQLEEESQLSPSRSKRDAV